MMGKNIENCSVMILHKIYETISSTDSANYTAVVENGIEISYYTLWNNALQIASFLQRNVADEHYIGISLNKSAMFVSAILGTWISGKAFIPLGTDLPQKRKQYIIEDASLRYIIGENNISDILQTPVLNLSNYALPNNPNQPAYIIYSSGTTGRPKGIIVTHRGLYNLAAEQSKAFLVDKSSRYLWFVSVNFDASVSDLLVTLYKGATLIIDNTISSVQMSRELFDIIEKNGITHVDIPPVILPLQNIDKFPKTLKTVVIGGEVANLETVRTWAQLCNLVVVYGPTEASVCTSLCRCGSKWSKPIIGQPIHGITYGVFNDERPANDGELWISGDALADGYLNNNELTQRKFIMKDGRRWYRTGDHVKIEDGEYVFEGRIDRQVKHNGQLIELEEIEMCIRSCRGIGNAAVVYRKKTKNSDRNTIVAFLCGTDFKIAEITKHIEECLPKYMLPQHFEVLSEMPLSISGKPDYTALSTCELIEAQSENDVDDPINSTELEVVITNIVSEVLKDKTIKKDTDITSLADSVDVLLILGLLETRTGYSLTADAIREFKTPEKIAVSLQAERGDAVSTEWLFEKAEEVAKKIDTKITTELKTGKVLFTGVTGFLGSHLLNEFLQMSNDDVYCIVRGENGWDRLLATFNKYQLNAKLLSKVHVVKGDVCEQNLGVEKSAYDYLTSNISDVYHCAAKVSMMDTMTGLYKQNVDSSEKILQFCVTNNKKALHYASTLSVYVSTDNNTGKVTETPLVKSNECMVYGGYAQTKYLSECLVWKFSDVIPVNVFRFGLLTGATKTGIGAAKDFLGMFISGAIKFKSLPLNDNSLNLSVDITPVDMAAKAVCMATLESRNSGIYHIASKNHLSYADMLDAICSRFAVRGIPYDEWKDIDSGEDVEMYATKIALCRYNEDLFKKHRQMDLFQGTAIDFSCEHIKQFFTLNWNEKDLFKMYLERL